uniref:RRM domain-containing protein n=1 Tax=Denticeps clupeoides TaxID=299321 RepID=A0AAY4DKN7_9TELE
MHKDALKLSLSSRLDQDCSPLTPPSPALPGGSLSKRWPQAVVWPNWDALDMSDGPFSIEREARLHRQAAAVNEAACTWSGQLPPKNYKNPLYSCKVFLGGVPWDVTEASLINTFSMYGPLSVEWPGKDGKHPRCPPKGYVYLVFECEKSVKALLQACIQDMLHPDEYGEYYYKMSSRRMRCKDVQVIPWVISDSNYVRCPSQRLVPSKTVFVGALHGMLNAEALAIIMNDLFGGVMYAGIDTDKHKYPIGSGRVTFNNQRSYLKAVSAAFVEIKTPKFTKKVQIDPYLEDSNCQVCNRQSGTFFCRDLACFKYYCRSCWHWQHSPEVMSSHRPLMPPFYISCILGPHHASYCLYLLMPVSAFLDFHSLPVR